MKQSHRRGFGSGLHAAMRSHTGAQFGRYSVVGLTGFVIDFGLYGVLTRTIPFWRTYYIGANVISFCCAVVNNFIWHKLWTFREQPEATEAAAVKTTHARQPREQASARRLGGQFVTFLVVSVIGLILNSLILRTVSQQALVQSVFAGHSDLFAKMVAVPIVWMWNFGANKLWTFRKG